MRSKLTNVLAALLTIMCLCMTPAAFCAESAVVVSSLDELYPYLSQDGVNVKLTPGTYIYTFKKATTKPFKNSTAEVVEGTLSHAMLLVKGSNSTYDFEGVTIEIETAVFNAHEGCQFAELHILGNNNVVKNLTLQDVGAPLDYPKWGCLNIIMDGESNQIDNITVRSTGSFPWGYGELFGKGGPRTIRHWKHSACLVRGLKNHVKDCKIYHRAYGHCLFMQAADQPLIEGCYIEGAMSTTDAVLAEKGTGSRADKIDFKTVWGYPVPPGYTISLVEAGIRVYNTGFTMINGERFKRGTSNVTVKDCYVKNVRAGVTLTHTMGYRSVENTTTIGCERGFAVGTGGKIINCKSDCQYGPAFGVDYERDRNIEVDITLLPNEGEPLSGNGTTQVAYIVGSDHNITFRKGEGLNEEDDLHIYIGGDSKTDGSLDKDENYKATNINFVNETEYKIIFDDQSSVNTVSTKGVWDDYGVDNKVTKL